MPSTFGGSMPVHHRDNPARSTEGERDERDNASRPAQVILSMTIQLKEVSYEDHGP